MDASKGWRHRSAQLRLGLLEYGRLVNLGYKAEHFRAALQFAIACGVATIVQSVDALRGFYLSAFFIYMFIALMAEPLVGTALLKTLPCAAGLVLGTILGAGAALTWSGICFNAINNQGLGACSSLLQSSLAVLGGALIMLVWARFPAYTTACQGTLLMFYICTFLPEINAAAPGGDQRWDIEPSDYAEKGLYLLAAITGIVISIISSVLALPNTASRRVRRQSGHILESLGNINFALLGAFLQEPGPDGKLAGASGTDEKLGFVDDGLERKFSPLERQVRQAESDIYDSSQLLLAAWAEERIFRLLCYREGIRLQAIQTILACSKRVATEHAAALSACTDGRMRLGLCQRHRPLMEQVRQDLAAVFTALAVLVHAAVTEEEVVERFRNLADSLVELYHGATVAADASYDADLETFALFTKTCITCARQMALVFREFSAEKGKSLLAYIAASFALTTSATAERGGWDPGQPGAAVGRTISRIVAGGGGEVGAAERNDAQALLDRVLSKQTFHADDNPFDSLPRGFSLVSRQGSLASLQGSRRFSLSPGDWDLGPLGGSPRGYHHCDNVQPAASHNMQSSLAAAKCDRRLLADTGGWDEERIRRHLLGKQYATPEGSRRGPRGALPVADRSQDSEGSLSSSDSRPGSPGGGVTPWDAAYVHERLNLHGAISERLPSLSRPLSSVPASGIGKRGSTERLGGWVLSLEDAPQPAADPAAPPPPRRSFQGARPLGGGASRRPDPDEPGSPLQEQLQPSAARRASCELPHRQLQPGMARRGSGELPHGFLELETIPERGHVHGADAPEAAEAEEAAARADALDPQAPQQRSTSLASSDGSFKSAVGSADSAARSPPRLSASAGLSLSQSIDQPEQSFASAAGSWASGVTLPAASSGQPPLQDSGHGAPAAGDRTASDEAGARQERAAAEAPSAAVRRSVRDMVVREGRARNWSLWGSQEADPFLRLWLRKGEPLPANAAPAEPHPGSADVPKLDRPASGPPADASGPFPQDRGWAPPPTATQEPGPQPAAAAPLPAHVALTVRPHESAHEHQGASKRTSRTTELARKAVRELRDRGP